MKPYCTRNNGDCFYCSLAGYDVDCKGNFIEFSSTDAYKEFPTNTTFIDSDDDDMEGGHEVTLWKKNTGSPLLLPRN